MKSYIPAFIDASLARELKQFARLEKKKSSHVIESLLRDFFSEKKNNHPGIVTSSGKFAGTFHRGDAYER